MIDSDGRVSVCIISESEDPHRREEMAARFQEFVWHVINGRVAALDCPNKEGGPNEVMLCLTDRSITEDDGASVAAGNIVPVAKLVMKDTNDLGNFVPPFDLVSDTADMVQELLADEEE